MKSKLVIASAVLLSGLTMATQSIAADSNMTETSSQHSSSSASIANIAFKPVDSVTLADALSASTGSAFKGELTSYENDGNENTTTRGGLRVRKSSVIVALQHNLGINVADQLTDPAKFVEAINKILPAANALKEADLSNLDSVVISAMPATNDVNTDVVPDSKTNPLIEMALRFTLNAKPGTTIGAGKSAQIVLSGNTKVKLTDYRRVDQSTLKVVSKAVPVAVSEKKPATVTYGSLVTALNNHFDITSPAFATPLFPIWNIDPASNKPLFIDASNGEPVKHSLSAQQVDTLAAMYTGLDGTGKGNFGKARIERAVQKVVFVPADGKSDSEKVAAKGGAYDGKFDVTITFIQHWSWDASAYTDRKADFTLKAVPIKVTFNKK